MEQLSKNNKNNRLIGRIVALNSGDVSDCCTLVKTQTKTMQLNINAVGKNNGNVSGIVLDKLQFEQSEQSYNVKVPTDNSDNFETVTISTADELIDFARKLNSGDVETAKAFVKLQNDIDLKGKEWEPLGNDVGNAFSGVFDGNRNTISNFVIKGKSTAKGFFGYLKGEVYNLTVNCVITGKNTGAGETCGGIAAHNDGGTIGNCAAVVGLVGLICGKGKYGALVGSNTGKIFRCYTAGLIRLKTIKWYIGFPILSLIALIVVALLLPTSETLPMFVPLPNDPGIQRIPGQVGMTEGNAVSLRFERVISVDTSTGLCLLNMVHPGTSTHNMVVQICITDAQAFEIMGSAGRSDADQRKLGENPMYDPENHRMVLAESGNIPPGYRLESIPLLSQPNGAVIPAGEYDAIAYLTFYNPESNARVMVETQFAVTLQVK